MFGYDLVVRYRRRQPDRVTIELSTSDSDNDEPVIINDVPLSNLYVAASAVLSAAEAGTSSAAMDGQLQHQPIHSNPSQPQQANSHSNMIATPPAPPAEPINLDSSSDDDCQFVLARKPPHLRTPEYVSLNSDSDSDVVFVQEDRTVKANETLNASGVSTSSSAGTSAGTAGTSSSNVSLPLKKRRHLSEAQSTSSEDNKPLILHLNLKKNTVSRLKRRHHSRGNSAAESSTDCDEVEQDWENKIKKTKIKSNRRKEVALHKYIKGAVNQGASTSSGVSRVKSVFENSSDSGSEDAGSSDDEDEEDMKPLKSSQDRTINIKIIKNHNSFCSVVNEGGSPVKRKRKTSSKSSNSSRKTSTKKAPARTKKKRNKASCSSDEGEEEDGDEDDGEESIDVVNRFDSTESSSNDSF